MSTFLNYSIPGIPYGCDVALVAVGLVLTFRATGVFNLAFGGQAFVAAFLFDLLVRSEHVPVGLAFLVAVVLFSPAFGWLLDRALFRHIPTASTTAKVVSAVGLLIAIPATIPIIFGGSTRENPPNLWLNPNVTYVHIFGTPINGGEISTTVITVVVVGALMAMFQWTAFGLKMRAVVESRRMSQLEGVNSPAVSGAAWALSSLLAGLAGVLLLPLSPVLSPTNPLQFTSLLVAGLTAAAVASMTSVPIALIASILLGVVENLISGYLPGGVLATAATAVFPFAVLMGALIFNPKLRTLDQSSDPLASVDPPPAPRAIAVRDRRLDVPTKWGFRIVVVVFIVSSLTWVPDVWVTGLAMGETLSIVFLSITLITGMSGQLSLCQWSFAGIGAFTAGQLATHLGLSVLLGSLLGALLAAATGVVLAMVAVRLSGLLLTLMTLTFALFADELLFEYSWSGGGLSGVNVPRPLVGPLNFTSDRSFLVLAFVVLAATMGLVVLVQRGTTGRYLAAIRGSRTAAESLGINLTRARLQVFALSAGLAGLGGALYGSLYHSVDATTFPYEYSLVYAVVVITTGANTVEGAVQAGMAYAVFNVALTYLPVRFQGIEPILFAFGAMTYASHPEGIVEFQKTRWLKRVNRLLAAMDERRSGRTGAAGVPSALPGASGVTAAAGDRISG